MRGMGSSLLRRCYGSVRKLTGFRNEPPERDVEAAVPGGTGSTELALLEPARLVRKSSHHTQSEDGSLDAHGVEGHHTAANPDHQPQIHQGLASLPIRSDSCPHLLSDAENERMNKKIDKLIAAIRDCRLIHFEPDAETGEVEIFADHEAIDQDDAESALERDIAASPENFGRIIRFGNGVRRMRSASSLRSNTSTNSWASTHSAKSSSNARERAVAAASIRFALANAEEEYVDVGIRQPSRGSRMEREARRSRRSIPKVSPVPLDFHKPLRMSTPSIHSNGSEQDTSSPLFGKSCQYIRRDTYAEPPQRRFQGESAEPSQLDEFAVISEPRDVHSPEASKVKAPSSTSRAFGVFHDNSGGESRSRRNGKSALRSKVLKDISNLRRPGYLQFNSFAKDTKSTDNQARTTAPDTESSVGFGGASNPELRKAYIKRRWPGLLDDRGNGSMVEPPRLDGAARRRNEQAIGLPIDTSLYSLTHERTSLAGMSLVSNPARQAHFDLALARLEGRALPPPPSPIERHPDSAALYDRDIGTEGDLRPLPLCGPAPSRPLKPTLRRSWWRNFW